MGVYSLPAALCFEYMVACQCQRTFGCEAEIDNSAGAQYCSQIRADQAQREKERAKIAANLIVTHIRHHRWPACKVIWAGMERPREGSAADLIFIRSDSKDPIRYSLKSVRGGSGTAKNLGLSNLGDMLRVDFSPIVSRALEKVRSSFASRDSEISRELAQCHGWAQMKDVIHSIDPRKKAIENKVAMDSYRPFQREIAETSAEAFCRLSSSEKAKVVYNLLGCEEGTYLLIANREGISLLDPSPLESFIRVANLSACMNPGGHSWSIKAIVTGKTAGVALIRINSAATNRLGLSDPCQRSFLTQDALHRFQRFP